MIATGIFDKLEIKMNSIFHVLRVEPASAVGNEVVEATTHKAFHVCAF